MAAPKSDDIIFVGDVHLGRRPTGLDGVLQDQGLRPIELSPGVALANLVDEVLDSGARAVVFAGDLVDQEDDRFEAYSILEREVKRLREAEVPVLVVAGNHDGLVLPRLIQRVDGVHQLGVGGVWERHELPGDGEPVDLLGWSFPSRHFHTCPLDHSSYAQVAGGIRAGATALGVLHCDLGASTSNYAPVPRSKLDQTLLAGWFLGHVHKPGDLSASRPIGYLGSLVGLDRGEPGARGPWRVRAAKGGGVETEQLALVPIRWETIEVTLEDEHAVNGDALHERIEKATLAHLEADDRLTDERLKLVVGKIHLKGRLSNGVEVQEFLKNHEPRNTVFRLGQMPVIVARLVNETRPAVDLSVLASEPSPIGKVASRLLQLQEGPPDGSLEDAQVALDAVIEGRKGIDEDDYPLPSLETLLERAAWRVLDTLLEQRRKAEG
jgi:exonuclease SbcD